MVAAEKKYRLNELKLGMTVRKSQLSEIHDIYIILTGVKNTDEGLSGTIGFIGKEITNEVARLRSSHIPLTCVYNDSIESGDDVTYDESIY